MNGIDYFLELNNIKTGELAQYLGIKQPQINLWKDGTRRIPDKHLFSMIQFFNVPDDKTYLITNTNLTEIDKCEIKIIHLNNTLAELKETEPKTPDELLEIQTNILKHENEIKLLKSRIKLLGLTDEFYAAMRDATLMDQLNSPEKFQMKLDIGKEAIDALIKKLDSL